MMKFDILFIVSHLGSGGSQRVLLNMVQHYIQHNLRVAVVTIHNHQTDQYVLPDTAGRYCLRSSGQGVLSNIKSVLELRGLIKRLNPNVAISFICGTNILAILACIGLKLRLIISERNDPKRQNVGRIWNLLRRVCYRFANSVTANSRSALQAMHSYVNPAKLYWVPNPIIKPDSIIPKKFDFPFVLAVGRLHQQKAYDVLLKAFSEFYRTNNSWRLVILGEGGLSRELQSLAEKLDITDAVIWEGQVADPWPYYSAAKMYVLPSRYEGMPNALLEAMACGLPVIISDAVEAGLEYVEHEKSGLVVPAESVAALTNGIQWLAHDEGLANCLGLEGMTRVKVHDLNIAFAAWDKVVLNQ